MQLDAVGRAVGRGWACSWTWLGVQLDVVGRGIPPSPALTADSVRPTGTPDAFEEFRSLSAAFRSNEVMAEDYYLRYARPERVLVLFCVWSGYFCTTDTSVTTLIALA